MTTGGEPVRIHPGDLPSASRGTHDGRGGGVASGGDPVSEANRFVEGAVGALPGGAPAVIIVIGPGLGYAVDAIWRRAASTRVIAIEPSPGIAAAMLSRRSWRESIESGQLTLLTGPD